MTKPLRSPVAEARRLRLQANPPALLGAPYRAPRGCRAGKWINDELLGLVEVAGWTEAPTPWPRRKHPGLPVLILTDELARAVRTESVQAVSYWWGVSTSKVWHWRDALGVDRGTDGTRKLLSDTTGDLARQVGVKGRASMTAESRERAAAKRRGKPAHPKTRDALLRGAKKQKPEGWGAKANAWMLEGKTRAQEAREQSDD